MTADKTTARLVEFASALRLEELPELARAAAKARILSTLAVALAAFDMEPVRIARKLAQPVAAGPSATIFGDDLADPGWTQALEKFDMLMRERLHREARDAIVRSVSRLETERDLRKLVGLTRLAPTFT